MRAAVLGANDGIVSTASLIVGVASAHAERSAVLVAGVAGLVAGAMSMAAGEYVSVSSQADTERADLEKERGHIESDPSAERDELAEIYVSRGVTAETARQVADELMAYDALAAHTRDELGISELARARPVQAAFASAGSFAIGGLVPLLAVIVETSAGMTATVATATLVALAGLGAIAGRIGGASAVMGAARVTFWGILAMGFTALVGRLVGTAL